MTIRTFLPQIAGFLILAVAFTGCGNNHRESKHELRAEVTSTTFLSEQKLGHPTILRMQVRNSGTGPIANLAITVQPFDNQSTQPGLADPERPTWVIDAEPRSGATALNSTWAFGKLQPGAARTLSWLVTPVVAGNHTLQYTVSAALAEKGRDYHRAPILDRGKLEVHVLAKPVSISDR